MTSLSKYLVSLFAFLCLVSAWQPEHGCPEAIKVTIPNNQEYVSEGERYETIWDQYDNVGSGIATMVDVHTVLLSCPDIKCLDVHPRYIGCTGFPDRWNIPWSLDGSDKIPPLESITLTDYSFNQREWDRIVPPQEFAAPADNDTAKSWLAPWKVWFHSGKAEKWFDVRLLSKEQREKSNLDLWLDQMDWTKLKSLTIIDELDVPEGEALYNRLPKMVPGLESLTVKGPWWEDPPIYREVLGEGSESEVTENVRKAKEFILAFPENSLKSLSWLKSEIRNTTEVVDILEHHGQSLTSFEWRDAEDEVDRRPVFSQDQLRQISRLAPNLKSLTIDVNRNGSWPFEELATIAESFPKLTELTLYMEIANDCYRSQGHYARSDICSRQECYGWQQFERPLLDEKEAERMFEFLREKKVGDELTSVTFRHGDWESQPLDMIGIETFLDRKKSFMECTEFNPDGSRKAEGTDVCQGKATDLSSYEKLQLERCEIDRHPDRERLLYGRDEL